MGRYTPNGKTSPRRGRWGDGNIVDGQMMGRSLTPEERARWFSEVDAIRQGRDKVKLRPMPGKVNSVDDLRAVRKELDQIKRLLNNLILRL
jgi:hypothetical protein